MENIRDLHAQARTFERGGQHAAALELYGRILEEPSGDREGGIWARVGYLHAALGDPSSAVESYATAIDRYAAAGLDNLALSFCQRLLRIDDSRSDILLRFGQMSAHSGYPRDARHGFVEYADRAAGSGDTDSAVNALREYLGHYSDDAAVRRRISELTGVDEAEPVATPADPIQLAEGSLPGLIPTTHTSEPALGEAPATLPGLDAPLVGEPLSDGDERPRDGRYDSVERLEGFEPTHSVQSSNDAPHAPQSARDTPQLEQWTGALDVRVGGADVSSGQIPDPIDSEDAAEDAEPLPLLRFDAASDERVSSDPIQNARNRVAREPSNLEARRDLVALLRVRNDPDLETVLTDAEREFAGAGRAREALEFVEHLARLHPENTALQQRRLERALHAGDRRGLVDAYLALARRFEAELDTVRAEDCLRHVLDLDPANQEARTALASATAAAGPTRDYIDLGDLILADAPDEITRFQVDIGDPTGNEESDFAEILDLFRKKVSESLDPKDAASHYDLGLAFKEMGLFEDAIVHLQSALRGGANPLATLEVLGQCFVLKGQLSLAARVFERAARLDGVGDSDLVGVLYGLAHCQQELGRPEEARSSFERVVAVDLSFRDAAKRLEALETE